MEGSARGLPEKAAENRAFLSIGDVKTLDGEGGSPWVPTRNTIQGEVAQRVVVHTLGLIILQRLGLVGTRSR